MKVTCLSFKQHFFLFEIRFSQNLLCARYLSYGSGPKRFPLADVLQYAMEFASSKPVCTSPVEDIDTTAPPGGMTAQLPPPARQVFIQLFQEGKFFKNSSEILKCFLLGLQHRGSAGCICLTRGLLLWYAGPAAATTAAAKGFDP